MCKIYFRLSGWEIICVRCLIISYLQKAILVSSDRASLFTFLALERSFRESMESA